MLTTGVDSGPAALALLKHEFFDLMFLDVQMPGMDGFEVAQRVKEHWPQSPMKIAILTSIGLRGDAARCRALNIHAYLTKPIKGSELMEAIQRLFAESPSGQHSLAQSFITRHSLAEQKTYSRPLRPLKILLAEDNRVNQALERRILEKEHHTVVLAGDGRQALQAFERESFDLILMDVQMPEMDGFEATAAIREREAVARIANGGSRRGRIPIIALTAHAMIGDRERCLSAGMDGFITKPIRVDELLQIIAASCEDNMDDRLEAEPLSI
jgi:two-component system sensor histidine kinase/response regulator